MPTYDWRCPNGHTWEANRVIAERDVPLACPFCGEDGKRVFLKPPILGWSPASADGGRSNYRERVRIPDTD